MDWDVLFWGLGALVTAALAVWYDQRHWNASEARELQRDARVDGLREHIAGLEVRVALLEQGEGEPD